MYYLNVYKHMFKIIESTIGGFRSYNNTYEFIKIHQENLQFKFFPNKLCVAI